MNSWTVVLMGWILCAEAPVPDPAELMAVVRAHQKTMDEVRENYTYHHARQVEELGGGGAVKKTTSLEREVFFVNGRQIGRLISRNGKPLSDEEDRKERERTRKLAVEFATKPASFGKGGGVNLISTILAVADVSNPRRTEVNGRSTIAFDFKGNPKAEAHGMEANGAKKVAGTVWIDEADRQVARLEVEFYEPFHIAGGLLASIQKGTIIRVEQSPIGEGLWMQTANEQHMNARVITMSLHENIHARNFDFKRFNVDEVQQIGKPAAK